MNTRPVPAAIECNLCNCKSAVIYDVPIPSIGNRWAYVCPRCYNEERLCPPMPGKSLIDSANGTRLVTDQAWDQRHPELAAAVKEHKKIANETAMVYIDAFDLTDQLYGDEGLTMQIAYAQIPWEGELR